MRTVEMTVSDGGGEASSRGSLIAAVIGPLALLAAALLVFTSAPDLSSSDARTQIAEFYSDDGGSATLAIAEPLALIGLFAFLWLTGRVHQGLKAISSTNNRPAMALAGGVGFSVMTGISLVAQTTVAGTAAFSSSFEADPNTAMLFSHFGYVTLAAAMIGGSVMAFSTAGALRAAKKRIATFSYVVGVLGLVGMFFVYLPLVVFLVWAVIVGSTIRPQLSS